MAYATIRDIEDRLPEGRTIDAKMCQSMLDDIAVLIDSFNRDADAEAKKIVSCRAVIRTINSDSSAPMGATQGTMSALGYSQTWTMGTGASVGQLYLDKTDKKYLGVSSRIGSHSPLEDM